MIYYLKFLLAFAICFFGFQEAALAQDIIYKKDGTILNCKILGKSSDYYHYAYSDSSKKIFLEKLAIKLVDSTNNYSKDSIPAYVFSEVLDTTSIIKDSASKKKRLVFSAGVSGSIGNILEFNPPSGSDKRNLSLTLGLDLGLDYEAKSGKLATTNELHYLISIQKSGFAKTNFFQRLTDQLLTLHDFSVAKGINAKWNINLIVKTATSIFSIYDGDYFKDVNGLGKIQSFLSPYDITFSPGVKWTPDDYLRVSFSPYSFNMYGIESREVTKTGVFITETDDLGNYKRYLFKKLGAELNIWYDRKIKSWLEMQYRVDISSNYYENFVKNGIVNGLFITKAKIIKDFFVSHRATLKAGLASSSPKPFYSQAILLNYFKNF